MDPAVAVSLWLLNAAVVPDAYTRIVSAATSRSQSKRLEKAVRRDTGIRPGVIYRRWLRDDATYADLVSRTQAGYDRLVDRLAAAQAHGLLRSRPEDRPRAVRMVDATIAFFLPTLDPSLAVAVADFRSERRHEEVLSRLDASTDFGQRVDLLPPVVRPTLRNEVAHRGLAERVVDGMVNGAPQATLAGWCNQRPHWLVNAPATITLVLAQLAQAYGLRREAGNLFEEAGDLGLDPTRWYGRAALEAHAIGDGQTCDQRFEKATSAGGGPIVDFLRAAILGEWSAALSALSAEDAEADPAMGPLYAVALGEVSGRDAQIAFLERLHTTYPEFTSISLRLAEELLARALVPGTTSRDLDLRRAADLAVDARDERRVWRGDSGAAVEVACQAAVMAGDYRRVIQLGTAEPDGDAWAEEAAVPEVQFNVAQAAMATGDRALVEHVAAAASAFHSALLQAELLATGDADRAEVTAMYDAAWALASDERDQVAYWLSASSFGLDPLQGAADLEARTDDLPLMCRASQLIAEARFDDAIQMLRPRRDREAIRRLLVNAYMQMGDVDAAVTELLDIAHRFANVDHGVRAVEILVGADRVADAAYHADRVLPSVPPGRPERSFLHEVGVAAAHNRQDWPDVESRVRAWIGNCGADRRRRWFLVLAIFNQGNAELAWQVLQEDHEATAAESALEAQLWIVLHARFRPSPETLGEILDLARRFEGDPGVRASAVNAFFLMGDDKGDIEEEELAEWQALIRDRAENPDPDDTFIRVTMPEDTDDIVEAFRPLLEGQAQLLDTWLRKLRTEVWPYGMLARVSGRPYAATLAQRPLGFLPVASEDPSVTALEVEAASAAITGGRAIADTSVIVVASYVRELWAQLMASFGAIEVVPETVHDAAVAADTNHPRSNETLGWDLRADRPVIHTTDDEALDRLEEQLAWVHSQIRSLSVHRSRTEREETNDLGPWMATFHAAQAAGAPLWADDVGLRVLARNEGIPTFGTDSLLVALQRLGRLGPELVAATLETLRVEYCVDLPLDLDWIRRAAEQDEWSPGPALLAVSRPAFWRQPRSAYQLWSGIADGAAGDDHSKVAAWVYGAATGLCAASVDVAQTLKLTSAVLVNAATIVDFDATAFASCAAAASAACTDGGCPDPTEPALLMALDLLQQRLGPELAASTLARLGSELADDHREILRRVLFEP